MNAKKTLLTLLTALCSILAMCGCGNSGNISMSFSSNNVESELIVINLVNSTQENLYYGSRWESLEVYQNGEWVIVEPVENICSVSVLLILEPEEQTNINFSYKEYGDLPAGRYRATKEFTIGDPKTGETELVNVEFEMG